MRRRIARGAVGARPPILLALVTLVASACGEAHIAEIHRDAWGAPHVVAETDEGAVFGMAWVLAEDDWPLIEINYLNALGRSAELVGEAGVGDDWMARALEIVPLSIAEYEAATPRMRGLLDAFADGMNAWLSTRPDDQLRVLRRIEPWYPLALIRFKYYQNEFLGYAGLRGAWVDRLLAEGLAGEAALVSGDPARTALADGRYLEAQFDRSGRRPRGSNTWALAPSRTASGHALLLINPHQSFVGVQRYAEIHLDSDEGLRFSGLTVFGFLLPYMGHNERLGWAYTDNYADHSDLWALDFDDPAEPLAYRYDGGYRAAESWTDTLVVAGDAGQERWPARFWKSHHGPVVGIDDRGRPLAVRLARMAEGGWFDQWDGMIRARSLDEWRAAVQPLRVAYMNTMYADADGNIGYIYNSAVPRRNPGVDPSGVLDGSDPATEWQGFHGLDELPQVWNPPSGWLLNTNSTPFTATVDLPFAREDFPAYMVGAETDNARAVSSRRVLERTSDVTFEGFQAMIWDTRLSLADEALPALFAEFERIGSSGTDVSQLAVGDARLTDVVERFQAWNRRADTASVETTWFVLMNERLRMEGGEAGGDLPWTGALGQALGSLQGEWGTTEVPWGRINRHQRPLPGEPVELDPARPNLAVGGAGGWLGSVFVFNSGPFGSPAPRVGTSGNSFVKVVEFGPEPRAASVLNYGQSGHPASAHFFDQADLYRQRRFKPAWFDRRDVERNAARSYLVGG